MAPKKTSVIETQKAAKRILILEAAVKVFAKYGYDGASISMIAQEAKIAKGLLYTYFESKEALLEQLMAWGLEKVGSMTGEAESMEIPDETVFIESLRQMIEGVLAESDFWRLYYMVIMQPALVERFMSQAQAFIEVYLQVYMRYFERKGSPDPMAEALLFGAVIDGIMFNLLMMPELYPLDRVLAMIRIKFA